jgi:aromatic amino acid aminotransferase I
MGLNECIDGMGQLYVAELLSNPPRGWGFNGYVHWCHQLAIEYERKRDLLLKHLREGFGDKWGEIADADVPVAGMFVCLNIAVSKLPIYQTIIDDTQHASTNTTQIMDTLFNKLFDAGVVVMPAATFAIQGYGANDAGNILDVGRLFRDSSVCSGC